MEKQTERSAQSQNHTSTDTSLSQVEDAVMKTAIQYFGDELLTFLGIEGTTAYIAPTEQVHLDLKKQYQDFNLVMEDGSWKHFEFQSTNEGISGLKRFRTYEAVASQQYGVSITTYVLYSGNIKNPMTEFTEGINTYRICPIIMKDWIAEELIKQLQQKRDSGISLTKEDLVPLTLSPLMGGQMPQEERFSHAFQLIQQSSSLDVQVRLKMEAMTYALATKFLNKMSLRKLMEVIHMTELGQMLMDKGIQKGIQEGIQEGIKMVARNLLNTAMTDEGIAENTGLTLEEIQQLRKEKEAGI